MAAKPRLKARKAQDAVDEARGVSKTVMDSAQQIWLAGLGAFSKAQAEGGKLFEALVKEGSALDAKTRRFTEAKVSEVRGNVESTIGQARERSQETWDKLEKIFEDRVSRALGRMGIPSQDDMQSLSKRVDDLSRDVHKRAPAKAAAKRAATKQPGSKRPAAKRSSK
ncbi:MAG: phasin family protein [Dokdonella sp.]|uniref:phasin family protein n=1 Tax=Dokdonella sp. TaxID=2291710 RepID=UPI003267AB6B